MESIWKKHIYRGDHFVISFLFDHLGKPQRKKPSRPDFVPLIFIYKSDREVSKSQSKLKLYQSAKKEEWGMIIFWKYIQKEVLHEGIARKTSSNIVDVKNSNVPVKTGTSKTVSFKDIKNLQLT